MEGTDYFLLPRDAPAPPGVTNFGDLSTSSIGFVRVTNARASTKTTVHTWSELDAKVAAMGGSFKRKTKAQVRQIRVMRESGSALGKEIAAGMEGPDEDIDVQMQPGTSSMARETANTQDCLLQGTLPQESRGTGTPTPYQ